MRGAVVLLPDASLGGGFGQTGFRGERQGEQGALSTCSGLIEGARWALWVHSVRRQTFLCVRDPD